MNRGHVARSLRWVKGLSKEVAKQLKLLAKTSTRNPICRAAQREKEAKIPK